MNNREGIENPTAKFRRTPKGVLTNTYSKQVHRSKIKNMPPPEYTLKEFQDKFLSDPKYLRLFREWEASGYKKSRKPSFDRIDHRLPYSFDNINVMSWEDNRYKQRMEFKIIRRRKVAQYDKFGDLVTVFDSITSAVSSTGLSQGGISACVCNKAKTCGGFYWKYADDRPRSYRVRDSSRVCLNCGNKFSTYNRNQKYCSVSCGYIGAKNTVKRSSTTPTY